MFKIGNFNPDPVWHRHISFAKSAVRILAGIVMMLIDIEWAAIAGALIIAAEALGIIEEIV